MPHLVHPAYRADIDGLRAIAVLSVVIFHAFPNVLKGGFVGVDVFFVISGFLISNIIYGSLDRQSFSFVEFYIRRVRRIFPCLSLVLVACLALGWFQLFADEYRQLGKHTAAGAGFLSNFALWQESGYFDSASDVKPLLHLWSLGIEEQFYIVWPLLLWLAWKKRLNLLRITIGIALLSFVLNVVTARHGGVAAFYSPLTRFWELLAGAILAYVQQHPRETVIDTSSRLRGWMRRIFYIPPEHAPQTGSQIRSTLGAMFLLTGLTLITREKVFPGFWATLPVMGATLLISAGSQAWFNRHILANRALVWVGLISFPLYLWHWPILSFLRIIYGDDLAWTSRALALAAATCLAWLSYRFVETPIRFGGSGRAKALAMLAIVAILGCAGFAVYLTQGFKSRAINIYAAQLEYKPETFGYMSCKSAGILDDEISNCLLDGEAPDTALVGDSHAEDKFHGIAKTNTDRSWILLGNNSCPPVLGIEVIFDDPHCKQKFEKIFQYLAENKQIKNVVISFSLGYMMPDVVAADHLKLKINPADVQVRSDEFKGDKPATFSYGLESAVEDLLKHNKKVIILVDVPELPYFPRDCIRQAKDCTISRAAVLERQAPHRAMIAGIQRRHPSIGVFDPIDLFCDQSHCRIDSGDSLLYRDSHHLSLQGSHLLGLAFKQWRNVNADF